MSTARDGFVVLVEMDTAPGDFAAFKELILANARASVRDEPGCRQFDVSVPKDAAQRVVLYEVYNDEAAFQAHMQTPHYKAFAAAAGPLITARRLVLCEMLGANRK
jgi:autoinducer 2-degrading protein